MNKKNIFLLLSIFQGCLLADANTLAASQDAELIVFIHGTIKPPEISFSSLVKIMNDDMDNSIMALATERLRTDPFFYRGQPIQELGLQPIEFETHADEVTVRTAHTIKEIYEYQYNLHNKKSPKRLYYTFGWSGLLSNSKRYQAAQKLYHALSHEIKRLKSIGINPRLTLVTYSHGGNVALYLARVQEGLTENENANNNLSIDNLIMLACPIQKETDYFVSSSMFKKVYNFYSLEDYVQSWDLFSSQAQLFSQRTFQDRRTFRVPSKVTQVRIRATKKIKGINPEKIKDGTVLLSQLPAKYFEHRDPGHMEIGGFSWGNYWYRSTFPLFPFSIQALVPSIIFAVENTFPGKTSLTFDFISAYNCALISDKKSKTKKIVNLWTPEEKKELWNKVSSNVPLDYTFYNQADHIDQALRAARDKILLNKGNRKHRNPHNKTLVRLLLKADQNVLAHNTKRSSTLQFKNPKKSHRLTHNIVYI